MGHRPLIDWMSGQGHCTKSLLHDEIYSTRTQGLYDPGATSFPVAPVLTLLVFPPGINATECAQRPDCIFRSDFSRQLQGAFVYHFFGLLWTNQCITGFG